MRHLTVTVGTVVAFLFMCLVPASGGNDFGTKILRISGSHSVARVVSAYAQKFNELNHDVTVIVSGGHTAKGFRKFLAGNVEMVMAARNLSESEKNEANQRGVEPVAKMIGSVPVPIITHSTNAVSELTIDQLSKIFRGEYTNWKQLGGNDEPINLVVIDDPMSETVHSLQKHVLQGAQFSSSAQHKTLHRSVPIVVSNTKGSIGFSCLTDLRILEETGKADSVKLIRIKKDEPSDTGSVPVARDASDPDYPVTIPIYLFYNANAKGKLAETFVRYVLHSKSSSKVKNRQEPVEHAG